MAGLFPGAPAGGQFLCIFAQGGKPSASRGFPACHPADWVPACDPAKAIAGLPSAPDKQTEPEN